MDAPVAAPKIAVTAVRKSFTSPDGRRLPVLEDVSLEVPDHRFVCVIGPSGCGKTTLLRLIDGLIAPDRGTIAVSHRPPRPGANVGFVFQSFRLLPWATVGANVALPLELAGVPPGERAGRVVRYLDLVGLTPFADAYPNTLSGGMKQRVALARALVAEPEVLLMDEPFGSLDAMTREIMQTELMRIWEVRRQAVVFVTHSIDEAILLGDRVVVMSDRPGCIVDVVDIPLPRPRSAYDVRAAPAFVALRGALWAALRSGTAAGADRPRPVPAPG